MSILLTPLQLPDESILDINGKQNYLGNGYMACTDLVNYATASAESPLMSLSNPAANGIQAKPGVSSIGLFQYSRKFTVSPIARDVTLKLYLNPTIAGAGTALTPVNLKTGSTNSSLMTCHKSPTVTGVQQVQTIDATASTAGSLNNTYLYLSSINPANVQKLWYLWFNVNSTGTDPMISGRTGIEVDIAAGTVTSANVAIAMRSALNALTGDFVATGATNHVIVTNVNAGACAIASDGAQPTGFVFNNTTPGSSAFGTYLSTIKTNEESLSDTLIVIDPGSILLVTASVGTANTTVSSELVWYEL